MFVEDSWTVDLLLHVCLWIVNQKLIFRYMYVCGEFINSWSPVTSMFVEDFWIVDIYIMHVCGGFMNRWCPVMFVEGPWTVYLFQVYLWKVHEQLISYYLYVCEGFMNSWSPVTSMFIESSWIVDLLFHVCLWRINEQLIPQNITGDQLAYGNGYMSSP